MKVGKRVKESNLTEDQVMHLCHAWMLDWLYHPFYALHGDIGFPFRDDAHRRQLYFKHREYLLGLAGKGHIDGLFAELPAGEKPAAFFDYEETGAEVKHVGTTSTANAAK